MAREQTNTVSFRMRRREWLLLKQQAVEADQSPGEHARAIVRDALLPTTEHILEQSFEDLEHDIAELRRDISVTLEVLLLNVAKLPAATVQEFVRDKLRGAK